jgi:hypothetical protein
MNECRPAYRWELHKSLLANPSLRVGQLEILAAVHNLHALLYIRRSSPLFRLQSAQDVKVKQNETK